MTEKEKCKLKECCGNVAGKPFKFYTLAAIEFSQKNPIILQIIGEMWVEAWVGMGIGG